MDAKFSNAPTVPEKIQCLNRSGKNVNAPKVQGKILVLHQFKEESNFSTVQRVIHFSNKSGNKIPLSHQFRKKNPKP